MEARLLIAFLLMGLVLFVTPYLYKPAPAPPAKPAEPAKSAQTAKPATPPPAAPAPEKKAAAPAGKESADQVRGTKDETYTIETDVYKVTFANKGAMVKSWQLKRYHDLTNQPLELFSAAAAARVPPPFFIEFKDRKPDTDINWVWWAAKLSDDKLGIEFDYSDGKVKAHKSFRFARNSYLSEVQSEVTVAGVSAPHVLVWRGGFGDPTVQNSYSVERALFYDTANSKLNFKVPKDAKNGPVSTSGSYQFAGLEDTYFAALALPKGNSSIELRVYSDSIPLPPDNKKEEPFVGAGIGGDGRNQFELFVGPKDTDLLKKVNPKLEQVIDWGTWFGWLAKPLFMALNWTNDNLVHNFGWAIILVTIGLNMLLLPVRLSGMKSAKKMAALQPEIQAINAKYKNLGLRDPKQAEKNQEVMALYQKHGVNPIASGCMPLVLQFPFFIAFYTVLTVAIELRGAQWFWVADLSRPEQLSIRILPIILIATQFISQKMTPPTPGVDPAQQKAMMIMPLALGFMFYYQSSGLVLYWLTGNLVGIAQQWLMNRATKTPPPAVVDVKPVKKR